MTSSSSSESSSPVVLDAELTGIPDGEPTPRQIKQWRRYLANERAEAETYRFLARHKTGEERDILNKLADSELRHERHWREKLGPAAGKDVRPDLQTRFNSIMAKWFGSVFTLALLQNAESHSSYLKDQDAPPAMAADEKIHAEVVRSLAQRSREKMSGSFRAAVFGANDGLVSNLSLVLGVLGSGVGPRMVLITGLAGLLSGALSMAAGEYISVRSQTELLEASQPSKDAARVIPLIDVDENELSLVYRARGMSQEEAEKRSKLVLDNCNLADSEEIGNKHEAIGNPWGAASSSFCAFAVGAAIPVIPFTLGAPLEIGAVITLVLVSMALMMTGGITGILSGKPPVRRALRQWAIGMIAAFCTFALGRIFGGGI